MPTSQIIEGLPNPTLALGTGLPAGKHPIEVIPYALKGLPVIVELPVRQFALPQPGVGTNR